MNAVKKILIEAPLRGTANAVSAMVKDRLYQGKRSWAYQQAGEQGQQGQLVDPLAGLVSGVEQAAPSIIKWVLIGAAIYYGLKVLDSRIGRDNAGVLAGCRCVEWRCD